jgi:hypothetical protein
VNFRLEFQPEAIEALEILEQTDPKKYAKVQKTLGLMETNLKHHSLQTHKFDSLSGPNGEEVFEAYVENRTPAAYRIFWYYGPEKNVLTVVAITPHP